MILLILSILILSIGCGRIQILSQQGKYSQFAKLITALHLKEEAGVNLPFGASMPFVEGSSGKQYIGNFFLTADVDGSMQKLLVIDDEGIQHQVDVYKLEKLKINIKPKALYGVQITHNDVTAGMVAGDTRVKFTDASFAKYTLQGDTIIHEEYADDADTKTGNQVTKTVYFDEMYVPQNFKITMRFDVGEAGSQDEVRTPAILGAYVPVIVEWKPFPNAVGGGDPSLGEYQGKVVGYVSDAYTLQPIRYQEMTIAGHPSSYNDKTTTDHLGYFEFIVPLRTNLEQTEIYPQNYALNLRTCQQNCKYTGIFDVKELFREKHGITNFNYKDGLHYPLPEEPNLWIEIDNMLYFKPVWVQDKVKSRQKNHHDFYVQPAPPGAYLRINKDPYDLHMIKTNQLIEFEGFGVDGIGEVTKWILDFGDGNQTSGTGDHVKQEYSYAEPGNYTVGFKVGTYHDFWSPAYTQTIYVKKAMSHANLRIIPSYLCINKTEDGEFIPITVTINGSASEQEGSKAVEWILEPYNMTGTGNSFEIKKTFYKPGNYSISTRFKDEHGQWGYGMSKIIRIMYKPLNITKEEKYGVRTIPSEGFITVKNRELQFSGLAENVGFRPYGENLDVVLKYKWDFNGDGIFEYSSNIPNEKVYRTFKNPGIYNVTFEVEDPDHYKERKIIPIEVINVYATFDIQPSSVIKDGTVIDAWYTFHNKYTKDIDVKYHVMYWEHKTGTYFHFSHYEPGSRYTGIVRAGESKEMWRERETVCCPGMRRGVAIMTTDYGEVKTSLTKTILPAAQQNQTPQNQTPAPAPTVTIGSAKNSYDTVEPITVTLTSNIPNTLCDLKYSFNSGAWVNAGTSTTNNNGATQFARANNPAGAYQAKAVCNNVESNVLTLTVAAPAPQYTVNFRMNKYTFSHEKLLAGRDAIIYVVETNMPNTLCDIYAKLVVGRNNKIGTLTTWNNGNGVIRIGGPGISVNVEPGTWSAYGVCNGIESNKVRYTVTTEVPQQSEPPKIKDPTKEEPIKTAEQGIAPVPEIKRMPAGFKKLTTRTVMELNKENISKSAIFVALFLILFITYSGLDKRNK